MTSPDQQTSLTETVELPADPPPIDTTGALDEPSTVVIDRETGEIVPAAQAFDQVRPGGALSLKESADIGRVFAASGYFGGQGHPDVQERAKAQAITKVIAGQEIGVSPMQAMQGFHIIDGKPALGSGLVAMLVRRSGRYDYRVKVHTADECQLDWYQNGALVGASSFTMDEAHTAGLVKPRGGWEKFPKAMLFARALTAGARVYCPEIFGGSVYVPEELGASVNESGEPVE